MGFMTVTCHFIDKDWKMESMVLETTHIPESHTIANLAAELRSVTEKWNITNKIHCAVTDAASNITGAVKSNRWNNLVCTAHKLNLVVTCAINEVEEVKEIMEKVKRIVSYIHRSTKASEKLRMMQARLNLPEHKLIQQVETRWNSAFYMLERYIEQEEAVTTTLCVLDKNDIVIPADQKELMQEIIAILRPFEAVTTELSAEKYVSASKVLPLARALQRLTSGYVGIGSKLSDKLAEQMSTRFSNMEDKAVLAVATLLDPRFKKIPFLSAVDKMTRQIINDASALTTQPQDADDREPTSECTSSSGADLVWDDFDKQAAASTSRRTPSISSLTELKQYFKQPVISRNKDPLEWWSKNAHTFPSLERVAKVYLSAVATSVPSERLFSKAGELISAKRNRIKPKNVNMLLFLNKV